MCNVIVGGINVSNHPSHKAYSHILPDYTKKKKKTNKTVLLYIMQNEQHSFTKSLDSLLSEDSYNLKMRVVSSCVFSFHLAFAHPRLVLYFLISFQLIKCLCHGQIQVKLVLTTFSRNSWCHSLSLYYTIVHVIFFT